MNIYMPLEDRILLQEIKKTELEKTDSGVLLTDLSKKVSEAKVIAAGPGIYARETGVFMPTSLAKGDIALIVYGAGLPLTLDMGNGREDFTLLREGDILMFVKKSEE